MQGGIVANIEVFGLESFIDLICQYRVSSKHLDCELTFVRMASSMGVLLVVLAILTRWNRWIEESTIRRI